MAEDETIKTDVVVRRTWDTESGYVSADPAIDDGTERALVRERAAQGLCEPDDNLCLRY